MAKLYEFDQAELMNWLADRPEGIQEVTLVLRSPGGFTTTMHYLPTCASHVEIEREWRQRRRVRREREHVEAQSPPYADG